MSFVTLLKTERLIAGTDRLVYGPDEIGHLGTVVEQCDALDELLQVEQVKIDQMAQQGYQAGFDEGRQEGYSDGQAQVARELVALSQTMNDQRNQLQRQTGELALEIVRRIASELGPANVLAALAASAAEELVPKTPMVLKVHQDQCHSVSARLETIASAALDISVVGDNTLELDACLLETEFGQVKADLNTQLSAIRDKFHAA
jgi:flagellar biosynthesis/type III secretory pathway protein FliH